MNYSVWIEEYEKQMFELNSIIVKLQNELKNCKEIDEGENLKQRIQSIRIMYSECRHTLDYLKLRGGVSNGRYST